MSLIHNERIKLTANALDRASTAALAVGVLGSAVGALYGFGPSGGPPTVLLLLGSSFWLCVAASLHLVARLVLQRLQ